MLNPATLATLNRLATFEVETLDPNEKVAAIRTQELADGSGRWATTLDIHETHDGEVTEYTLTIIAPAPDTAPAWAAVHTDYRLEQRDSNGGTLYTTTLDPNSTIYA